VHVVIFFFDSMDRTDDVAMAKATTIDSPSNQLVSLLEGVIICFFKREEDDSKTAIHIVLWSIYA
jgi:hypothetical protein